MTDAVSRSRKGNALDRRIAITLTVAIAALTLLPAQSAFASARTTKLAAVLRLTPKVTQVGLAVTASMNGSSTPSGTTATKIRIAWGDGSIATLPNLAAKPTHRYGRPGLYKAVLSITDSRRSTTSGSATETVTADPGSYTAVDPDTDYGAGDPITFYVAVGGRELENVAMTDTTVLCTESTATSDHFTLADAAIGSNGSFAGAGTQKGVFGGSAATFTYSFKGRLGALKSGKEAASGTFEETVVYDISNVVNRCTTDLQPWSATRDSQPTQTTTAPADGSYTAVDPDTDYGAGDPITFYVASSGRELENIAMTDVTVYCTETTATQDHLTLSSAAVSATGAFSGSETQSGVFAGTAAKFTYVFKGDFEGKNPNDIQRAAGTFEETITYPTVDGVNTCTTDLQPWSATRDSQPTQTTTAPADGSYTAVDPDTDYGAGDPITFTVAGSGRDIENVSLQTTTLYCTETTATQSQFALASAAVSSVGAFDGSMVSDGTFAGVPATFTYAFTGDFEGHGISGIERAAGTIEETVTYTKSGVQNDCTTDLQIWSGSQT